MKVNITRYMEKHALRIKTLHPGHPTRALMSHEWELSDVPTSDLNAEMPFRVGRRSKSKSPMAHFEKMAKTTDERFHVLASVCRPGDRLIDRDGDDAIEHVLFYRDKRDNHDDNIKSIPKKKGGENGKVGDDFKDWIHNTWTPAASTYMHDRNTLMIWSDGSVIPGKDDNYLQVKGKPNLQKNKGVGCICHYAQ